MASTSCLLLFLMLLFLFSQNPVVTVATAVQPYNAPNGIALDYRINKIFIAALLSLSAELCTSIECHYGATCKVDANYKAPYCDCEQLQCDNTALPTNHPANRTQLVCGSDEKTYTLCELKRAACWRQKRIEILHYSACVNKKNADSGKISHSNSKSASDKGRMAEKFNYHSISFYLSFYLSFKPFQPFLKPEIQM